MSETVVTGEVARVVAANTRGMFEQLDGHLKEATSKATCKKGCAHCCYLLALITLPDALVTAEHVLAREDWADWLPRLRDAAALTDYEGVTHVNYFAKQIRCVFLGADNACQVYAARPSTCRLHLVVSDPFHCSPASPTGQVAQLDFRYVEDQILMSAPGTYDGVPLVGPIPQMVALGMALLTQDDPRHAVVMEVVEPMQSPSEWLQKHGERISTIRRRQIRELNR